MRSIFKYFFIILVILSFWVMAFIGFKFFFKLHHYLLYSTEIPGVIDKWTLKKIGFEKYMIEATYHYVFEEKLYTHAFCFSKTIYPNIYLAQQDIDKKKERITSIWINSKNPSQSQLEHSFPLKPGFYFIISFVVLAYFIFLKFKLNYFYIDNRKIES